MMNLDSEIKDLLKLSVRKTLETQIESVCNISDKLIEANIVGTSLEDHIKTSITIYMNGVDIDTLIGDFEKSEESIETGLDIETLNALSSILQK